MLEEAINHFREALRINPEDPEVHYNLGVARYIQGNLMVAIQHFYEVLRMGPRRFVGSKNP